MEVKLFDSRSGEKKVFKPIKENEVSMYYCGPTVYNYPHVGNMRTVVVFDVLSRFFKEIGYNVKCVRNYTDIDDKIIAKAEKENKTEIEVSSFYIDSYNKTCHDLNIMDLYKTPKVSDYMDQIIDFIDQLIKKGYAYKSGDDVFLSVNLDSEYGTLSKMKLNELDNGSRVSKNTNKKNESDFVLWKKTDDNGIKFDANFGKGRPGWHTECVVMINSIFKNHLIDIHGGGFDLKFPHHENELAQSKLLYNSDLANYWMHVGFINVNNEKMSKSLGNDLSAKDIIAKYSGNALRMFFINSHYRAPLNYTDENMEQAVIKVNKYLDLVNKLNFRFQLNNLKIKTDLIEKELYDSFLNYLSDDLNISNALTVLDELVKKINQSIRSNNVNAELESSLYNTLIKFIDILGFQYQIKKINKADIALYQKYINAKNNKDFALSDTLRKELVEKGII